MPSYSLDLNRLAAAYKADALTPEQVVRDIHADRARLADNPVWIHLVPEADAVQRARTLQARRDQGEVLPLYGVPFAVKDNIDVAGYPTTAACPEFAYVPQASAFAVQCLLDAGAVLIGKTNLDQFATGLVGTRSPYGACRNAFNPDYISGGSSSGSAVAVALGLVSFALGTDTAGSGRVPAGFNNLVGLKPTPGQVSTRGVVPACRSLDCVSVLALNCEDVASVLAVMAQRDALDPLMRDDAPVEGASTASALRCGVPAASQLQFYGDDLARAAFGKALDYLRSTGATLVEIDYQPFVDAARLLYDGPWVAERTAAVGEFVNAHADAVDPVVRGIVSGGARWSAVDAFKAQYRLAELKHAAAQQWAKMDVLVLPTTPTIYTHAQIAEAPLERNAHLGHYTNFVNLFDLCALAVPGPFRGDGLPAGTTLITHAQGERLLLDLGERVHRASGVTMGATGHALPAARDARPSSNSEVIVAVVGAHLSGLPLNHQLTSRGARLREATHTAPQYRLYALPDTVPPKPGLRKVLAGGAAIAVELWSLTPAAFGAFVAEVPPPLAIGTLMLSDGRAVKGFVCEPHALEGATDITALGGWRAYLAGMAGGTP